MRAGGPGCSSELAVFYGAYVMLALVEGHAGARNICHV